MSNQQSSLEHVQNAKVKHLQISLILYAESCVPHARYIQLYDIFMMALVRLILVQKEVARGNLDEQSSLDHCSFHAVDMCLSLVGLREQGAKGTVANTEFFRKSFLVHQIV